MHIGVIGVGAMEKTMPKSRPVRNCDSGPESQLKLRRVL